MIKNKKMNMEIWKDIPGYEGYYQVSNFGNVKSLSREVLRNGKHKIIAKEKQLKPGLQGIKGNQYYAVILYKNGIPKNKRVNILVAMAFLNHIPNGHKTEINHKDSNKLNNHLDNLEILTNREHKHKTNLTKSKTSIYNGVCFDRSKWTARIQIGKNKKHLGRYKTEYEAHYAYQSVLLSLNN